MKKPETIHQWIKFLVKLSDKLKIDLYELKASIAIETNHLSQRGKVLCPKFEFIIHYPEKDSEMINLHKLGLMKDMGFDLRISKKNGITGNVITSLLGDDEFGEMVECLQKN